MWVRILYGVSKGTRAHANMFFFFLVHIYEQAILAITVTQSANKTVWFVINDRGYRSLFSVKCVRMGVEDWLKSWPSPIWLAEEEGLVTRFECIFQTLRQVWEKHVRVTSPDSNAYKVLMTGVTSQFNGKSIVCSAACSVWRQKCITCTHYWRFVSGIHRSMRDSRQKSQ